MAFYQHQFSMSVHLPPAFLLSFPPPAFLPPVLPLFLPSSLPFFLKCLVFYFLFSLNLFYYLAIAHSIIFLLKISQQQILFIFTYLGSILFGTLPSFSEQTTVSSTPILKYFHHKQCCNESPCKHFSFHVSFCIDKSSSLMCKCQG